LKSREGKQKKELLGPVQNDRTPRKRPKKKQTAKAIEAGNLRAFHKLYIIEN
jgi:hypothetical protein